jgi:2-C-methyl-D-erythritol 4-phosphate cytidylyltransferase
MVIAGGDTRRASVDNALSAIASQLTVEEKSKSFVLIHDAARAFVTADILTRTKDAVVKHSAVTTAIPSTDSLVMVDPVTLRVERSLPRQKMYRVQTPQAFRFDLIEQAHRTYKGNPTDDASMVEPLHPIHVVLGDESNIKVTYRADLSTAP